MTKNFSNQLIVINLCVIHAKCVTIQIKNMQLINYLKKTMTEINKYL